MDNSGTTMCIHYATFNVLGINLQQEQNLMATSRNAILALLTFIVPVLIELINLKFQKEVEYSVFHVHPITTMVTVSSLLAFVLAFGVEFTFQYSCGAALLRTIMVFSGSLSLASLVTLLFPDALGPILYHVYALLSLGNLLSLVPRQWNWIHQKIMDKLETVFTGRRNPPLLPVTMMDTHYPVRIASCLTASPTVILSCNYSFLWLF